MKVSPESSQHNGSKKPSQMQMAQVWQHTTVNKIILWNMLEGDSQEWNSSETGNKRIWKSGRLKF